METSISNDWLPVYKALANPMRLQIIQLLARKAQSISALAAQLGVSETITAKHLNQLAATGIVSFSHQGHFKIAKLQVDQINIKFPISSTLLIMPIRLRFPLVTIPISQLLPHAVWQEETAILAALIIHHISWIRSASLPA